MTPAPRPRFAFLVVVGATWFCSIIGCCPRQAPKPTSAPSEKKPITPLRPRFSSTQPIIAGPVAAIWREGGSKLHDPRTHPEREQLIVGIWSDGTIVWSNDRRFGGRPYTKGKIEIAQVEKLADELNATGFFDLERQVNFGPDASYTVVAAQARGARQWVGSWHDPSLDGAVVTERGIGGDPHDPPSPAYSHFLKVWADARAVIEGVIPAAGDPAGEVDEAVYRLGL